jgi:peroxiredoxin
MMKIKSVGAAVVICALVGLVTAEETPAKVGSRAINFWLKPINGQAMESTTSAQKIKRPTMGLDQYVGERADYPAKGVVLTFFANYCVACKKELPELQKLFSQYRTKGLMVIAINTDSDPKELEEATKFVHAEGLTFPVLKDSLQVVRRRYGVSQYPATFVIDAGGIIKSFHDTFNERTLDALKREVIGFIGENG